VARGQKFLSIGILPSAYPFFFGNYFFHPGGGYYNCVSFVPLFIFLRILMLNLDKSKILQKHDTENFEHDIFLLFGLPSFF
jgi:hypothetical protein